MKSPEDIVHRAYIDWVRSEGVPVSDTDFGEFALRRLRDLGYRVVVDDGRHYAAIGLDGWSIQHPVQCREDMLSCWFHLAAQDQWQAGPPGPTGRWWIDRGTEDDPDELVLVERVR